jgi:hypothetical protein
MLKISLEIIGLLGGVATVLGLLLAPMIYIGGKIDKLREDMHAEMKDFHGKLCAIEERNKK